MAVGHVADVLCAEVQLRLGGTRQRNAFIYLVQMFGKTQRMDDKCLFSIQSPLRYGRASSTIIRWCESQGCFVIHTWQVATPSASGCGEVPSISRTILIDAYTTCRIAESTPPGRFVDVLQHSRSLQYCCTAAAGVVVASLALPAVPGAASSRRAVKSKTIVIDLINAAGTGNQHDGRAADGEEGRPSCSGCGPGGLMEMRCNLLTFCEAYARV